MKKVLCIIALVLPAFGYCQKCNKSKLPEIIFEFPKTGAICDSIFLPKKVEAGDFYRIRVKGVNLNNYYVSFSSKDTIYSHKLDFPTLGSIDVSEIQSLITTFMIGEEVGDSNGDEIAKNAKDFSNNKSNHFSVNKQSEFYPKQQTGVNVRKKIEAMLKYYNLKLLEYGEILLGFKKNISNKEFEYMNYRLHKSMLLKVDGIDPSSDLKLFLSYRGALDYLRQAVKKDVTELNAFIENNSDVQDFLSNSKNKDKKIELEKVFTDFNLITKKSNEITELISPQKVEELMKSVIYLYQETEYVSLPIQFNGEEASVEMTFTPKDPKSGLQTYKLPPIKFPKQSKYWSVSSTIYYSGMKTQRVGFEKIAINDTVTKYKAFKEDPLKAEIGTALLLRGGMILDNNLGVHFAVGTGISLGEEIRPRAMIGAGLSCGVYNRLTVDVGLNVGYTKVLSSHADLDKYYVDQPQFLINQLKASYFIGIGYTFNINKKK